MCPTIIQYVVNMKCVGHVRRFMKAQITTSIFIRSQIEIWCQIHEEACSGYFLVIYCSPNPTDNFCVFYSKFAEYGYQPEYSLMKRDAPTFIILTGCYTNN